MQPTCGQRLSVLIHVDLPEGATRVPSYDQQSAGLRRDDDSRAAPLQPPPTHAHHGRPPPTDRSSVGRGDGGESRERKSLSGGVVTRLHGPRELRELA